MVLRVEMLKLNAEQYGQTVRHQLDDGNYTQFLHCSLVITAHPSYDVSLWLFSQRNPIRHFCQRMVEPAYGDRIYGAKPYRTWAAAFKIVILCAIAGSIAIAAVATPVYRRDVRSSFRLSSICLHS